MVLRLCEENYRKLSSAYLLGYLASVTYKGHWRMQYNPDAKPGQLTFETKKIHRSNSTFSLLVLLAEQRTDKSLGVEGIFSKKVSRRICTNWKNSPKQKWGATFPLAPPGGATGKQLAENLERRVGLITISKDYRYYVVQKNALSIGATSD